MPDIICSPFGGYVYSPQEIMMDIVKIKSKESGYCIINAEDFDKDTMKLATKAEITAADKKHAKAKEANK